jgi:alpha-methylacyl-CoA racemase
MALCVGDVARIALNATEHPARYELVDSAVEDDRRSLRIEIRTELAIRLPVLDDPPDHADRTHKLLHARLHLSRARDLADHDTNDLGLAQPAAEQHGSDCAQLLRRRLVRALDVVQPPEHVLPVLAEDRVEHVVLRREVVVEQAVCDACFLGDVTDTRRVEPLAREHTRGRVEDQTPFLFGNRSPLTQGRRRVVVGSARMQALGGTLVVDFTRYLPGAFASSELRRLGARVVRVEQPGGDPMRHTAHEWHDALNAGKESVVCDLPADLELARGLLARADVVLESFRPGVAGRLGIGPDAVPARCVYCSITGFGRGGEHEQRAGHDLNYVGFAGLLETTAPALPPVQAADLAAGALGAVTEVLAALLARERTGEGARIVISMTHGAHRLLPGAPVLTEGFACYSIYDCADERRLTVAALEPRFFERLCEVVGRPELAARQYDADQPALRTELADVFATRSLEDWLRLFGSEDVCVGPVATRVEAEQAFGQPPSEPAPELGAHTAAWRGELGL